MLENGYIKIYRSLLKWEWYDDVNTKVVFLHLLLTANIDDSKWHGVTVKRGSRVSSYETLAKETCLSRQQVRTAIDKLTRTGEISTNSQHKKYTVFSVNNFDKFQTITNKQPTDNQQATNKQPQYKKDKKDKEDNIFLSTANEEENLSTFQQSPTLPTLEEVQAYAQANHICTDVQRFYNYYDGTGWRTKKGTPITDWRQTLRWWANHDGQYAAARKSKEDIPESPMADAYRSLVCNGDG